MSLKAAVGLPHPLTASQTSLPQNTHSASLWIEGRPAVANNGLATAPNNTWLSNEYNTDKDPRFVNDYAETMVTKTTSSGSESAPTYAEVGGGVAGTLTTFQAPPPPPRRLDDSFIETTPAPYASTTLVSASRHNLPGLVSFYESVLIYFSKNS